MPFTEYPHNVTVHISGVPKYYLASDQVQEVLPDLTATESVLISDESFMIHGIASLMRFADEKCDAVTEFSDDIASRIHDWVNALGADVSKLRMKTEIEPLQPMIQTYDMEFFSKLV